MQNHLGIVGAAAGVDASNTEPGTILLLPLDPDASAHIIASAIRAETGSRVDIIVRDTLGRPWRDGQTDVAIGAAGVHVFDRLQGELDSAGKPLIVTQPCVANALAAAGDLEWMPRCGRAGDGPSGWGSASPGSEYDRAPG